MSDTIRIGSRRSRLAMVQSEHVAAMIRQYAGVECTIIPVDTRGDLNRTQPLPEIGGKGLFTQELEDMLRAGQIDLAVHSLKDLPGELPKGLALGAISRREDPRDALVAPSSQTLRTLPQGARVGTGSVRRVAQLRALRPDVSVLPIRGNVPTRLDKLDAGEYDAIILAAAGLRRLDLSDRIGETISPDDFLPAPGQGALGLECREDDDVTRRAIDDAINDHPTAVCCRAERAVMAALDAGCNAPMGAYASISQGDVTLAAFASTLDGTRFARAKETGPAEEFESVAAGVVASLAEQGAHDILAAARHE